MPLPLLTTTIGSFQAQYTPIRDWFDISQKGGMNCAQTTRNYEADLQNKKK